MKSPHLFFVALSISINAYGFQFDGLGAGTSLQRVSEALSSNGHSIAKVHGRRDGLDQYAVKRSEPDLIIEESIFFCRDRLVGTKEVVMAITPFSYMKGLSSLYQKNGPTTFEVSLRNSEGREFVELKSKWESSAEFLEVEYVIFEEQEYGFEASTHYVKNECGSLD